MAASTGIDRLARALLTAIVRSARCSDRMVDCGFDRLDQGSGQRIAVAIGRLSDPTGPNASEA